MNGGGRIVIHMSRDTILVCKAFSSGHHDDAYKYARTRIFKETGSGLEYVSVSDNVTYDDDFDSDYDSDQLRHTGHQNYSAEDVSELDQTELLPLFVDFTDVQIEECGVTAVELKLVREITSEKGLFLLEESISSLAHDNLVALYLGDELPNKLVAGDLVPDPASYGFVEYDGSEEIKAALSKPWASWLVFLSASQKQIVNANYKGSSKVFGGAGTGKTVVALHRAKRLAETTKTSTSRGIGLLTFSRVLANDLIDKADLLMGAKTEIREKVFVSHLDYLAFESLRQNAGKSLELTTEYTIKSILAELHREYGLVDQFTPEFVFSEYMNVVGPWGACNFSEI